jgi:hypothetical protein
MSERTPQTGTDPDGLAPRLQALAQWLAACQPLWQPRPFTGTDPDWVTGLRDLGAWLLDIGARGDAAVDALHATLSEAPFATLDGAPDTWQALVAEAAHHTTWAEWQGPAAPSTPRPAGIPDRKWREIEGFTAAVARADALATPSDTSFAPWIADWCAGKAHVGRTLARSLGARLWALDHDEALARDAAALAEADGVTLRFDRCDLRTSPPAAPPRPLGWVVGMHACGGLGNRMLEFALAVDAPAVALAPCCLHRHHDAPGWPICSATARATGLTLDHAALRLATADEVVARPTLRRRRRRDEAFRQAIDLRLREVSGHDAHHPLGTLPAGWFELDFAAFADRVGDRLGRDLGPPDALPATLREGTRRATRARALGAVRALFRRPLELFAALDRAVWLAEQGRRARLAAFCPRDVTPRNLLITSTRL